MTVNLPNIPAYNEFWRDLPPIETIMRDLLYATHSKITSECCGYLPAWYPIKNRPNIFRCAHCRKYTQVSAVLFPNIKQTFCLKEKIYTGCMLILYPELLELSVLKRTTILPKYTYHNYELFNNLDPKAWLPFLAYLEKKREVYARNKEQDAKNP